MSQSLFIDDTVSRRLNILEAEQNKKLRLRVQIDAGGCAGFQYQFSLEDGKQTIGNQDHCFEHKNGGTVVTDDLSLDFLKGATIAYQEEMIGSTFVVQNNPQAMASCGCKSSFSVA